MKCVPRLTCPGPQIRRPRVHPGPRGGRAERATAVRLSTSRQRGRRGRPGRSTAPWSGGPCGSTWAGRALPLCCTRAGHGRAGPCRTAPLLSRPTPIPHSGRARLLHSSPVHSGQAGRTRLQHCRVGEGLSAADLLKIRPSTKWNLKCVVFVSLLT